eukprot:305376-Chlamydomonas_euryale.AAC.1
MPQPRPCVLKAACIRHRSDLSAMHRLPQYALVPGPSGKHVSFGLWDNSSSSSQYNNIAFYTDPYTCFTFAVPTGSVCNPQTSEYNLFGNGCRWDGDGGGCRGMGVGAEGWEWVLRDGSGCRGMGVRADPQVWGALPRKFLQVGGPFHGSGSATYQLHPALPNLQVQARHLQLPLG